jgi:hypothetical protein
MPTVYSEIRKFLGLFRQPNSFDLPDGAMEHALNVFISDDNRVTKARGYYQYYDPAALTLNKLALFQSKLLALFSDRVAYFTDAGVSPNLTGTKTDLSGATVAVTGTRRSRTVEADGNLLATTDNGVLKLDAYNGKLYKAGAPSASDIRGSFDTENGIFEGDNQVAYRAIFGRRDANDRTQIGSPSDIIVLTNSKFTSLAYTNPSANLVEVTVGVQHNLVAGMTVTIADGSDAALNGTRTVVASGLTATVFRFDKGSAVAPGTGTLSVSVARKPILEFSVPREITTTTDLYFYQLYRTSFSGDDAVSPQSDFRLITEAYLTAAEITAGVVFFEDDIDEVLVTYAPELYTNENSQEGELQRNDRPPLCDDICFFNKRTVYAACTTRHILNVDVVDPSVMASNDYVELKIDSTTRRYVARTGVGNTNVSADSVSFVGTTVTVNYTAHGFATGHTVLVSNAKGTGTLPDGSYAITIAGANAFTFTVGVAPTTLTGLDFQGVTNGTNYIFTLDKSSSSVATRLRNTARGLIKAVNRDTGSIMQGNYASGITDTPGKMRFTATGFGGAIYMRANSAAAGGTFDPVLPASFAAGDQVYSRNSSRLGSLFMSKDQEGEAVPLANEVPVGSKNARIFRVAALRDCIIVTKADGTFKVTGDSPQNAVVTPLDSTVSIVAKDSLVVIANRAYFLSGEGFVTATDTGVEVVSRRIENIISPIVGRSAIDSDTAAVGYENHRTYRVSTIGPNDTSKTVAYAHNWLNDTWTEASVLFTDGIVGPSDVLFLISSNKIIKERKTQSRLDFVGQNYAVTVVSVAADMLSAVITTTGYTPVRGDIIVKNNVITRIDSVAAFGSNWAVLFSRRTNLAAADAPTLYAAFESIIEMAPYHGGEVGQVKQFSEFQSHMRGFDMYRCELTFATYMFGSSPKVTWNSSDLATVGGWGFEPWGLFTWGQTEGIMNQYTTQPAPPIRTYVPAISQRTTWIKARIRHYEAGDEINLQAIGYRVRAYSARVSK